MATQDVVWPIMHIGKRGVLYKKRRIELDRPFPLRLQIREILTTFIPGRNPVNVIDPTGKYTYYLQSDGTMIREGEEEDYGLDKPIASVHSHPDVIPSLEKEKESINNYRQFYFGTLNHR